MTDYGNGIDECVLCKENVETGLCESCEMSFHIPPPLPVFVRPQYRFKDYKEMMELIPKKLGEIGIEIDMFPPRHPFEFHGFGYQNEKFVEFYIDLYSEDPKNSSGYIDFNRRDGDSYLFCLIRHSFDSLLEKKESKWKQPDANVVRELFPDWGK
jgi:hypothetical protein